MIVKGNAGQVSQGDIHNQSEQSFTFTENEKESPQNHKKSPIKGTNEMKNLMEDLCSLLKEQQDYQGNELVLILGPTGDGKSTTLNYLLGKKMKIVGDKYEVDGKTEIAIGHGLGKNSSKTLVPNIAEIDGIHFADCPGFFDNHNLATRIANAINVTRLISQFKKIKILLILSYSHFNGARGDIVQKTLAQLRNFFRDSHFENSIIIGITKVERKLIGTSQQSLQELKNKIKPFCEKMGFPLYNHCFHFTPNPLQEEALQEMKFAGGIKKEKILERIHSLQPIEDHTLFQPPLGLEELLELTRLSLEIKADIISKFLNDEIKESADQFNLFNKLKEIDHSDINKLIEECKKTIRKQILKLEELAKNPTEAKEKLNHIKGVFEIELTHPEEVWERVKEQLTPENQTIRVEKSASNVAGGSIHIGQQNIYYDFQTRPNGVAESKTLQESFSKIIKLQSSRINRKEKQEAVYHEMLQLSKELKDDPHLPNFAFGKQKWEKHLGDVDIEPQLPSNIENILDSPCPFWENMKIRETHFLVLIPQVVDGKPFNLNLLKKLIEKPRLGFPTKFGGYNCDVKEAYGNRSLLSTYWILMTYNILPNSLKKTYKEQKALLKKAKKIEGISYTFPKTLEAATAILVQYVERGKRFFTDENFCTYTRCQEKVEKKGPITIGGFGKFGIDISNLHYGNGEHNGTCGVIRIKDPSYERYPKEFFQRF